LFKPHGDFLVASDVTYNKTVARGSNAAYVGRRSAWQIAIWRRRPHQHPTTKDLTLLGGYLRVPFRCQRTGRAFEQSPRHK
jgi:hypothetical protein